MGENPQSGKGTPLDILANSLEKNTFPYLIDRPASIPPFRHRLDFALLCFRTLHLCLCLYLWEF